MNLGEVWWRLFDVAIIEGFRTVRRVLLLASWRSDLDVSDGRAERMVLFIVFPLRESRSHSLVP